MIDRSDNNNVVATRTLCTFFVNWMWFEQDAAFDSSCTLDMKVRNFPGDKCVVQLAERSSNDVI